MVDHYENPRNVGSLDKSSKNVGTGLVGAPACGDVMKLQVSWIQVIVLLPRLQTPCCVCYQVFDSVLRYLQIQVDENGKIVDAKFKTFGCGSAIASSSLATEWVKGKSVSWYNTDNEGRLYRVFCGLFVVDLVVFLSPYRLTKL